MLTCLIMKAENEKSLMIVPKDREKMFDRTGHFFLIKTFSKLGIEENLRGLVSASTMPTADIILDGEWFHFPPHMCQKG